MFKRFFKSGFWWPAKGSKPYAGAIVGAGPTLPNDARAGALFYRTGDGALLLSEGDSWSGMRGVSAHCPFRLSLSATDPFPAADQTGKSTVYQLPVGFGDQIELYSAADGAWLSRTISDAGLSIAVPATVFRGFDVFDYWNGSAVELKTENWNQTSGSITNASAGSTCSVTTSAAHGLATGDLVGITGIVGTVGADADRGINNKVFRAQILFGTAINLIGADTTALAYTSGGTWYKLSNTRATDITKTNGRWVKSGNPEWRYVGSYSTGPTSGQTEDSIENRLGWNLFFRRPARLKKTETTDFWTYSTTTPRPANNKPLNRVAYFCGLDEDEVAAMVYGLTFNDSGTPTAVAQGIGMSRSDDFDCDVRGVYADLGTVKNMLAFYDGRPGLGYRFIQLMEISDAIPNSYFYGDAGLSYIQCGLKAKVWC